MKYIHTSEKSATGQIVAYLNSLPLETIFTVLDVQAALPLTRTANNIKTLLKIGAVVAVGKVKHEMTYVMRYSIVDRITCTGGGSRVIETTPSSRMTMPTVEVGGVWRDLFIKPHTIDPSVKMRVIREWR